MENNREKVMRALPVVMSVEDDRKISGVAAVFNSWSNDLGGFYEIINPSAITEDVLAKSDIIANVDHNDEYLMARSRNGKGSLKVELKSDGLYFEYEAPRTAKGDELLEHIRREEITECSFAFIVGRDNWFYDEENILRREILEIEELFDVSCVIRPAYSATYCENRAKEMVDKATEVLGTLTALEKEIEEM